MNNLLAATFEYAPWTDYYKNDLTGAWWIYFIQGVYTLW